MIWLLTISAIMYFVNLRAYGTTITPDGHYYLAMGRGASVPRPYALRMLPMMLTSVMQWRIIHIISYVIASMSMYYVAEAMHVNGSVVALAVMALPAFRQSIAWPLLLDMPLLAIASLTAFMASISVPYALILCAVSLVVHERAPIWCLIFCMPFVHWSLLAFMAVIHFVFVAKMYIDRDKHPDEDRIKWLKHPFRAAVERHIMSLNDWTAWVRPLGASLIGILSGGTWQILALAAGYAGCLVAQDRARIYSMSALPLTIAAASLLGDYAAFIIAINWFVPNTEV